MTNDKYLRLVTRLIEKTRRGEANWQIAPDDGVFTLPLADYSVNIAQLRSNSSSYETDIVISLVDPTGTTMDSVRDFELASELHEPNKLIAAMERLYAEARRKALGIDQALDAVLGELGE